MIDQTKEQIRTLVQEISELAQSDISLAEFYNGFLDRVVSALAAFGGAVWTVHDDGRVQLKYQINLSNTGLTDDRDGQARHALLLKKLAGSPQAMLVGPQSGSADDEAGNPTDFILLLEAVRAEQRVQAIVEIFQRPGSGPTTQRGYLRFLSQMCEMASGFVKSQRLRHFSDRQSLWEQLERFIARVHRSLDPQSTAFSIANEGRRLIECDRVSVAVCHGKRCRVRAVSGVDTIDHRAVAIRLLGRLATAVAATGETTWYTGETTDMPPQIEEAVQAYVDQSHCKMAAVVPLASPAREDTSNSRPGPTKVIGALVVERIDNSHATEGFRQRVDVVAEHSASALSNALAHHNLFLMPLWRALGEASWMIKARTLPKTITVVALVLAAIAALVLVPADFKLEGRGTLQPRHRRTIFAGIEGVVTDVPVQHGQTVQRGEELVRLRNTDLDVKIADLLGQRTATQEQILSVSRALLGKNRLDTDRQNELAGRLAQLKETAESLEKQLALYRRKEERLTVKSPVRGQVVTWQVRDTLIHRPVEKGEVLLTVVDPADRWELQIEMPESRMGHVARARREIGDNLPVTFVLATHPGEEYSGAVSEVHTAANVTDDEGSTVLVRVAIDKSELPDLRPGASVTAKVGCGRRPIGYVLFHDLIAFVQSKIMFWF